MSTGPDGAAAIQSLRSASRAKALARDSCFASKPMVQDVGRARPNNGLDDLECRCSKLEWRLFFRRYLKGARYTLCWRGRKAATIQLVRALEHLRMLRIVCWKRRNSRSRHWIRLQSCTLLYQTTNRVPITMLTSNTSSNATLSINDKFQSSKSALKIRMHHQDACL